MHFDPTLVYGILIKRYKRFLADVQLPDGRMVTAHCPNTGPMTGLVRPGTPVWMAVRGSGLGYRLQLVWQAQGTDPAAGLQEALSGSWGEVGASKQGLGEDQGTYVGVDTHMPNLLVRQGLLEGAFDAVLGPVQEVRAEVPLPPECAAGEQDSSLDDLLPSPRDLEGHKGLKNTNTLLTTTLHAGPVRSRSSQPRAGQPRSVQSRVVRSRLDFLVQTAGGPLYLEVKNVHMRRAEAACFPDAVTDRGTRHLRDLRRLQACGYRCVVMYIVQRQDCQVLALAQDIDPVYFQAFFTPTPLEAYAWSCQVSPQAITLKQQIPVQNLALP